MSTILDTLLALSRERVKAAERKLPLEQLKMKLPKKPCKGAFAFQKNLAKSGLAIIGEVKKASPSKGVIAEDFPYLDIAKSYEMGGVDAISVLTEPQYFLGSNAYLQEIAEIVKTPILRKDFIVSDYQIYESLYLGADAVLLIVAALTENQLKTYLTLANELGLSVLVEAHDATEIEKALQAGAKIIGVNNRNLKDFSVNLHNAESLRQQVPKDIIFVAESGITSLEAVEKFAHMGVDACLIGEFLMRSSQKMELIKAMKGIAK